MVRIVVDGVTYEASPDDNLLEALLTLKIDIPYFCWHPAMGSMGSCRQCAVIQYQNEEDERGRLVMACMTPVTEGAVFSTTAQVAVDFRQSVIESLMLSHPHDCPVCEEGGECHLQDMTVMVGHNVRAYDGQKTTFRNQRLGPFINHEMNRCINCYRCLRYYRDYAGGRDLAAFASRNRVFFGRHEDGTLESEFAGNLVEVCPTGVFTDKTLSEHYTRKWDLQSAPTICTACSLGCNTSTSERYGQLRRIHNRFNAKVNRYFLCDRGRFGGGYVSGDDRIPMAGTRREDGSYDPLSEEQAIRRAAEMVTGTSGRVVGIGSPRASIESNHLLRLLVGEDNFVTGSADASAAFNAQAVSILTEGNVRTPSLAEIEEADAVLVLGEDLTNSAPRLALALRQAVRNIAKGLAEAAQIPLWYDSAVRKIAQDARSPLILLTTYQDRLADVAALSRQMAPADIARLGFAVAHEIDSNFSAPGDLTSEEQALAAEIATILGGANKPLVIAGFGCQSTAVAQAAGNVAWALRGGNDDAGIALTVEEANSIGSALLHTDDQGALAKLLADGSNVGTVIVLENDLYRRASSGAVSDFLDAVDQVIVIDSLENGTSARADLVLPAATFAETDATLVNNEGRAQRSFAVFKAAGDVQGAWRWLLTLGKQLEASGFDAINTFDEVTADCARTHPLLTEIATAAPGSGHRTHGLKIARMTHRASGRTAMLAGRTIHEPQQPADESSALAFTMEGSQGASHNQLTPHVWSPGWNSNQSVHKYQESVGGGLEHVAPGVRLLEPAADGATLATRFTDMPSAASAGAPPKFAVQPRYHIFGSDELTARTTAIAAAMPDPCIALNASDAAVVGVESGDGVAFRLGEETHQVAVTIDDSVPPGQLQFLVGHAATIGLLFEAELTIEKATEWTRQEDPVLIARESA